MFILSQLKDKIRVTPDLFHLPLEEAIKGELNKRFSNRVIINVGLCISLYDILEIKESFIYQGDGSAHATVNFRLIVFRPFVGEVIVGKLRSCSLEGVHVSLGFFDDIIIPHEYLQEPKRFDEKEQLWVWEYETEDGKHDLFMERGEEIRFKVKEESFTDTSPTGPTSKEKSTEEPQRRNVPYLIKGTISESGLGLTSWWQ